MGNMKYIIVGDDYLRRVYIFSDNVQHADMARDVGAALMGPSNSNNIVSAGFVSLNATNEGPKCICWGRSSSLDLNARPEDSDILNKEFKLTD